MHDIKYIRENAESFETAMRRRGLSNISSQILGLDQEKRQLQTEIQQLQQERKTLAQEVGKLKSQGQNADAVQERARLLNQKIADYEAKLNEDNLEPLLLALPNIMDADIPDGTDEAHNKEIRTWGKKPAIASPKQHFDIGEGLGLLDFEQAVKISGARFSILKGELARMERALASFMLDMHTTEFGYTEITPPALVKDDAMFGSGQLPKFAEDAFQTTNGYWLIPTSEVALVNLVREKILEQEELPLRLTAYSQCFRSEAGSAGKDTRGMIRQHQFSKVELISITTPEESVKEHERMTSIAEEVLKRLELPYRVILKCTGDTGFTAKKTYDLEVWLPGQDTYREISSCSNCGDFQARRMKTRYRIAGTDKDKLFPHTLNGSALAIGRTIVAILENYQQADGSFVIPNVLRSYMGGQTTVKKAA
ncbi:MAG: serine--tRNA ligase [Rickettsiales bacterium]|nr:serine--tRNA ligase [Rickettsiales bacterium]